MPELPETIISMLRSGIPRRTIGAVLNLTPAQIQARLANPATPDPIPPSIAPSPLWHMDDVLRTSNTPIYLAAQVAAEVKVGGALVFGRIDVRDADTTIRVSSDDLTVGGFNSVPLNPPDWMVYMLGSPSIDVIGPPIFLPCAPGQRTFRLQIIGSGKRFRNVQLGVLPL